MSNIKTLTAVYGHHETHGPQICAIEMLSKFSKEVDLVYCNLAKTTWNFPENVNLIMDRKKMVSQESIYKKSVAKRWFYFFRFAFILLKNISIKNYDLIVLFNPPAFFALCVIKRFVPNKSIIWYHNYDPIDINKTKKYSQNWFAYKAMLKKFPTLDFFSLPEENRKIFFPVNLLQHKYFIVPNYSLLELHGGEKRKIEGRKVSLVFAGVISEGNGLEDLIRLLKVNIAGKEIELVLKGFLQEGYKQKLIKLAEDYGVSDKMKIIPVGPWKEVPEIIRTCHIGIHIFSKADLISKTMGKGGSGKIFQYIGEGLPVLMSPAFYENFQEYDWAIPTQLDQESLLSNIEKVIENYEKLTQSAIKSFKNELNCNIFFDKIFISINSTLQSKNNSYE